ncbi:MAG: helix-turn-helix transcriptional regulator [Gemmatimonadaceae bacterium]
MRQSRERARRGGRKLTQAGLADAVGVERNTVSRWENGGMLPGDPAVVAALASALGVSADWLIGGDGVGGSGAADGAGESAGTRGDEFRDGVRGQYLNPAIEELPVRARAIASSYLDRLRGSGCSDVQVGAAVSLLLAGARNRLSSVPPDRRSEEDVCADLDAAWDMIVRILRRDGIRV